MTTDNDLRQAYRIIQCVKLNMSAEKNVCRSPRGACKVSNNICISLPDLCLTKYCEKSIANQISREIMSHKNPEMQDTRTCLKRPVSHAATCRPRWRWNGFFLSIGDEVWVIGRVTGLTNRPSRQNNCYPQHWTEIGLIFLGWLTASQIKCLILSHFIFACTAMWHNIYRDARGDTKWLTQIFGTRLVEIAISTNRIAKI